MDQKDRGRISCEMRCSDVDYINPRGGWSNKSFNGLQVIVGRTDHSLQYAGGAFSGTAGLVVANLAREGCYITPAIKCATRGPGASESHSGSQCYRRWLDTRLKTVVLCRDHFHTNGVVDAFLADGKRIYRSSGSTWITAREGERNFDCLVFCPFPESTSEVLAWATFILGWRDERKG